MGKLIETMPANQEGVLPLITAIVKGKRDTTILAAAGIDNPRPAEVTKTQWDAVLEVLEAASTKGWKVSGFSISMGSALGSLWQQAIRAERGDVIKAMCDCLNADDTSALLPLFGDDNRPRAARSDLPLVIAMQLLCQGDASTVINLPTLMQKAGPLRAIIATCRHLLGDGPWGDPGALASVKLASGASGDKRDTMLLHLLTGHEPTSFVGPSYAEKLSSKEAREGVSALAEASWAYKVWCNLSIALGRDLRFFAPTQGMLGAFSGGADDYNTGLSAAVYYVTQAYMDSADEAAVRAQGFGAEHDALLVTYKDALLAHVQRCSAEGDADKIERTALNLEHPLGQAVNNQRGVKGYVPFSSTLLTAGTWAAIEEHVKGLRSRTLAAELK